MFKHEAPTRIAVELLAEELEVGRSDRRCFALADPALLLESAKEVRMPLLNPRSHIAILAAIVAAAIAVGTAQAAVTDPRKCDYGTARKAACAQAAAKLVARKVLQKRVGQPYIWQGPMTCTSAGTLLRWRCTFGAQFPQLPPKGYVAVTYKATHTGWHVYTTIVATP